MQATRRDRVTLRPGVPADAPPLARIHRAARAAALPGLWERWSEAEVATWLAAVPKARPGGVTVAAEHATGAPVGYLALDAAGTEVLHLYNI
jgi:RimJ/RimL family protein N-acetyltransferase